MTERIIDVSEGVAHLSLENKLLVVVKDNVRTTVPVAEVGVLLLSSPYCTFTQPLMCALGEQGVCTVFCDGRSLPASIALPFAVHNECGERLRVQVNAPHVLRKQAWQQTVQAKLLSQAEALEHVRGGEDFGLRELANGVRSGDPNNCEAQGARIYWQHIFGAGFLRDRDAPGPNAILNYGYAVVRAITARAICCAGLHPGIGIFHRGRENPFCLADDLMEPLRARVDCLVATNLKEWKTLDKTVKTTLIQGILAPMMLDGNRADPFLCAHRTASSLAMLFLKETDKLVFPDSLFVH